jgi:hypothetical protein
MALYYSRSVLCELRRSCCDDASAVDGALLAGAVVLPGTWMLGSTKRPLVSQLSGLRAHDWARDPRVAKCSRSRRTDILTSSCTM